MKILIHTNKIYLCCYAGGIRYQVSTGENCTPDQFNAARQEIRKTHPCHKELNDMIMVAKTETDKAVRQLLNTGKLSQENFKREILSRIGSKRAEQPKENTFLSFVWELLSTTKKNKSRMNCLRSTAIKLNDLGETLKFSDITPAFFRKFCDKFSNYAPSTINRDISNIKYFMNEAVERGLTDNTAFRSSRFAKQKEQTEHIYLNSDDLITMYYADLNKTLSNSRDLFLFAAWTGQRYSDVSKYKVSDFNGETISVRQTKTKEVISVPIHYLLKSIIENRGMPKPVSNVQLNRNLPKICFAAGLTQIVAHEGRAQPRHTLVTSHTARRSFITNAIKAGIPIEQIKLMTGHSKDSRSFNKYNRLTSRENAELLTDHPFFNSKGEVKLRKVC